MKLVQVLTKFNISAFSNLSSDEADKSWVLAHSYSQQNDSYDFSNISFNEMLMISVNSSGGTQFASCYVPSFSPLMYLVDTSYLTRSNNILTMTTMRNDRDSEGIRKVTI